MKLNPAKGKMYNFITDTCNFIKGVCPHNCQYCYMRKWWPNMSAPRLDLKEFSGKRPEGKYIFVGSGIDMFAKEIHLEWIQRVLEHCFKLDNVYLFQSKNPARFHGLKFPEKTILGTTIETNKIPAKRILGTCPTPEERMIAISSMKARKMVTVEPVMDFDPDILLTWLIRINPEQVNIGADSGRNGLPEPSTNKIKWLVGSLKVAGIKVHLKDTLKRLL